MRRRFRSSRCPFTCDLCYVDRSECLKCERRARSGQRTLPELASKPVASNPAPLGEFCRECGEAVSTGSTLWFVCPVDGAWRSPSDRCRFVEWARGVDKVAGGKLMEVDAEYARRVT